MTTNFYVTEDKHGRLLEIIKSDSTGTYLLRDREWHWINPEDDEDLYPTFYEGNISEITRAQILGYLKKQSSL